VRAVAASNVTGAQPVTPVGSGDVQRDAVVVLGQRGQLVAAPDAAAELAQAVVEEPLKPPLRN
jgi:hypothetical protein